MKAIVVSEFGGENVLRYQETALPEPGENEVRIAISATGVNPVDTYIRSGNYGRLPQLPYTPGTDGAGIVDKVGTGVSHLKTGQRVFVAASLAKRNTGTYADYVVCDGSAVQPLPDASTFSQGAGLGTPGLAATYALFSRANLKPGETVLIHGATGGVGTLAVQLARQTGAFVIGTSGSAEGVAVLQDIGAHLVFNHREDGYLDKIREAIPAGLNVIIEMLANVNLVKDLSLVAVHGRIAVVGNRGSLDFNPRDIMSKDAAVHGIMVNNMPHEMFRENMFRLSAALENGLRVVVNQELPLRDAPQAHKAVLEGSGPGKIVLIKQAGE